MTDPAKTRPFLLREVKLPHWLTVLMLVYVMSSMVTLMIINPFLFLLTMVTAVVIAIILNRRSKESVPQGENEPTTLWEHLRIWPVWILIILGLGATLKVLDLVGLMTF